MLFVNIEKYSSSFHVYGRRKSVHGHDFESGPRLCEDYGASYTPFNNLARMHGRSFEQITICGYTLVGYVNVAQSVLTDRPCKANRSFAGLVIFYQNHKIVDPFENWFQVIPGLADTRDDFPTNLSVFWTHDGKWVLFYIKNGKIVHEELTEPCFIKGGDVVTLKEVITNRRQQLVTQQEQLEAQIERLSKYSFQLSDELDRAGFLQSGVFKSR